jgi:hypothetical protein
VCWRREARGPFSIIAASGLDVAANCRGPRGNLKAVRTLIATLKLVTNQAAQAAMGYVNAPVADAGVVGWTVLRKPCADGDLEPAGRSAASWPCTVAGPVSPVPVGTGAGADLTMCT